MTDYEVREKVLQFLYDNRHIRTHGIPVPEIAKTLELEIERVMGAARQLDDLYQVRYEKTIGGKGSVTITTDGITDIEGVGASTPITVNQNTFNTSSESGNSNVNVGDGTFNANEISVTAIAVAIENINSMNASPEEKQEAKSLLTKLTQHPLICAAVGGVVSGLA